MKEKVMVTVKEGKIYGFKTKTLYSGVEYYSFLGVPYGQLTGGGARFKDPVKAKPRNHILDATVEKEGCKQLSVKHKMIIGSEDCLYNNIHTPNIPSKGDSLKAVIVAIHPGGLFHGSPDRSYYGAPDFVMHKDIVYVCVGYRLHILGFLNMHKKECSGNQGIKDIILSLKWIKENIHVFGGDPNNVTLLGSSSGASIVHFLLLSPLAHGLYHKAILMGMYAFAPVVVRTLENVSLAQEFGEMIGYDGLPGENTKLLNFYKNIDFIRVLMARPERFLSNRVLQVYPASPFGITPEPGDKSPIPVSPDKLIPSTNRIPIIIGFCEREACMALVMLRTFKKSIGDCFHEAIRQNSWGWGAHLNEHELKSIRKEVEKFYLNGESIENAPQTVLCDIITDTALSDVYDSLINVIAADLPSSVYVYNFHYDGRLCWMRSRIANMMEAELKGAFHGADYSYWCYCEETAGKTMANIRPKDRQTIDTLTSLLTSFAKTSDPNYDGIEVQWNPTTPENPCHLIINETLQSKEGLLNGERMEFWHKLKNKYKKDCDNL